MDSKADSRKQRAQNLRYKGKRGGSHGSEPRQRDTKKDVITPLSQNLREDVEEVESSQARQGEGERGREREKGREGEGEGEGGGEGEETEIGVGRKSTGADYEALLSEFHADPFFHLSSKTENQSVFSEDWSFCDNLTTFLPPVEQVDVLSLDLEALTSHISSLSLSSRLTIPPEFLPPDENIDFTKFRDGKDDVSEVSDLGSFDSFDPSEWEWEFDEKSTEGSHGKPHGNSNEKSTEESKPDYLVEVLRMQDLKISDSNTDNQHMQKVPFPLKTTEESEVLEKTTLLEKATQSSMEQKSDLEARRVFLSIGENENQIEDELDTLLEMEKSDSFQSRGFFDEGKQVLKSASNFVPSNINKGEKEKNVEDELDKLLEVSDSFSNQGFFDKEKQVLESTSNFVPSNVNKGEKEKNVEDELDELLKVSDSFSNQVFFDKEKQILGSTSNFVPLNVDNAIKFEKKDVIPGKDSKDGANETKISSVSTSEDDFDAWLDSVIV